MTKQAPSSPGVAEGDQEPFDPNLTMRPAMIQPVWRGDKLTLFNGEPLFDQGLETFKAALNAFRKDLLGLAESLSGQSNYDRHFTNFLFEVVEWISGEESNQALIFELGQAKATFDDYWRVVEREWPDFQSTRSRTLRSQLGVILQKCPPWRDFKADVQPFTEDQASQAAAISEALAAALEEEGRDFVDPVIPKTLRRQARTPDVVGKSRTIEIRANDQLESTSNLLKSLMNKNGEVGRSALSPLKVVSEKSLKAFGEGVADGAASQAKRSGEDAIRRVFDALASNAARKGLMSGGGRAAEFLADLAHQMPHFFGWLNGVLTWFQNL